MVFLIGARFDKLHLARSLVDLGGRRGMKHMLDYLVARPEKGLLAYEMGIPTIVQYWRSFEQLDAFAKDKDDPHLDVWRKYWRRVGRTDRTGIWHETYLVKAGGYEAVYGNMPPRGLGKAGRLIPVSESSSARARLGALSAQDESAALMPGLIGQQRKPLAWTSISSQIDAYTASRPTPWRLAV